MMGGSDAPPPPPGPSASEVALQTSQKELLDLQRKQIEKSAKEQELLSPILYKTLGIEPQYDQQGNVTGYKEGALAERKRGIEGMFLDRSEAALKGELPINPALTRDLDEQEGTLRERLYKQLGPGWETSTPGIEALSNFNKRKNELFDASRRGDLTLSESLSLAREGSGLNTFGATMSAGNRFLPTAQGAGANAASRSAIHGRGHGVQADQRPARGARTTGEAGAITSLPRTPAKDEDREGGSRGSKASPRGQYAVA